MEPGSPSPDANWLRRFRNNLRVWYRCHARELPWRRTRDPYAVWISEIMLQQTTVAAVVPYFHRFLERFPDFRTLAAAPEDEVLRLWEGLGYYSRARNIHRTAQIVSREHDGRFPDTAEALEALPGIGRYTAGAIASFAYDRPAPIVEANTLRLYTRLLGYGGDPRSGEGQRLLWNFAGRILPRTSPGAFNQALMELGATVCTPSAPDCRRCPVRSGCRALAEGIAQELPRLPPRPEVTDVVEACVAVQDGRSWLLRRRGSEERWAGLWDFPRYAFGTGADDSSGMRRSSAAGRPGAGKRTRAAAPADNVAPAALRRLEAQVARQTGVTIAITDPLTEIRHSVTRYRIRLLCFLAQRRGGAALPEEELRWVLPQEFGDYPLSVTGRKLARLLARGHGYD